MIRNLFFFIFIQGLAFTTSAEATAETLVCRGETSFRQGPPWSGGANFPDKPVTGITIEKEENGGIRVLKDGKVFKGMESDEYKKKMRFGKNNDGWRFRIGRSSYQVFEKDGKCEIKVITDRLCPNIEYKFDFDNKIVYVNRNNIIYRVSDDSGFGVFYQYVSYLKTKSEISADEKNRLKSLWKKILDLDSSSQELLSEQINIASGDPKNIDLKKIEKALKKSDVDVKSYITDEYWKKTRRESVTSYLSDPSARKFCQKSGSYELNNRLDTKSVDQFYAKSFQEWQQREEKRGKNGRSSGGRGRG